MMTSMRIGEMLGLRWGRVDLERGTISVKETFYGGVFQTPKTRRSERTIPVGNLLLAAMTRWKESHPPSGPDDLVFRTRDGKPVRDRMLLKQLHGACARTGTPRLSWHSFRHLHGTYLSHLGVPIAVAQAQLGHADPRITLQVYTHLFPSAQSKAVAELENFLLLPPTVH